VYNPPKNIFAVPLDTKKNDREVETTMQRKFYCAALVVLMVLLVMSSGCRGLSTRPLRDTEDELLEPEDPEVPPVPENLAVPEGQEPSLKVYIAEQGNVVTLPFEEYIQGVVAAEMDPNWPVEALAAQAIIARTFTLQKITERGGVPERNAHASSDIKEFQAYNPAEITANVRTAVEETRGQVIVREGEFIRAWFHAYGGGQTAQADEGLNFEENPEYIHIVRSPGTDIIPPEEKEWQESFPLSQVQEVVREITGTNPGPIERASIAKKGPSGRAILFLFNDVEVNAPEFRLAIGSTEMRSTLLSRFEVEENQLVMEGTGYGHGVGMCQWGARALAEQGDDPQEIVDYFYRDVELAQIWE
jgi:stage II sporulation protein D